ncbi:MAG: hypothetical protein AAFZ52_04795 [Bacteroidota bacterium]
MEEHHQLSDTEFAEQFSRATLKPALFSHEAHLRLAWIHLRRYGKHQAEQNIPEQLQHFVTSLGARDKYNATLTLAAVKAVHHFILKSRSDNFPDFIREFPQLKHNFKGLLACHYGFDIYRSERAKREFLTPDLLPFD